MVSRRRRAVAARSGATNFVEQRVALDLCCARTEEGLGHAPRRMFRFTAPTFNGAPTPDRWTDRDVTVWPGADDSLPPGFGEDDPTIFDGHGKAWVWLSCLVCGREPDPVSLEWVRGQLAAQWAPGARVTLRRNV